jgi:hypothetical protein
MCRQNIKLNDQLNHVFIAHTSMYITQEDEGVSKGQGLDVEVPAVCPLCYRLRFPRAFRDHSPELFGFIQEKHDFSAFREKLKRLGYRLSANLLYWVLVSKVDLLSSHVPALITSSTL